MDQFSFTKISYTGNTNITNSYEYRTVSYCACRTRSQNKKVPETPRREKTEIFSG